jgi:hypothetical protein
MCSEFGLAMQDRPLLSYRQAEEQAEQKINKMAMYRTLTDEINELKVQLNKCMTQLGKYLVICSSHLNNTELKRMQFNFKITLFLY